MDTTQLMEWAENCIVDLHDGPKDNAQLLMVGQIYAQLAIANELKRANDDRDAELAYQERMAERQRMLDDC